MSDAAPDVAAKGKLNPNVGLMLKITAGAAIPALATLIFNFLNFFVDNYRNPNPPEVYESIFDVAIGCAFAILGICFSVSDKDTYLKLIVLLALLILAVLGGDVLYLFLHWSRLQLIVLVNILALIGLAWAIAKAG